MATNITVNTSKTHLTIVFDTTDYESAIYKPVDVIPVSRLGMEQGETVASPLVITNSQNGNRYTVDTAIGDINVSAVLATNNADIRTKILDAL